MTGTTGWLPTPVEDLFGPDATAEESYEVLTVDVPPESWIASLESARDTLGCTYFDWLSAVDEPGTEPGRGFRVSAHVVALAPVRRLLVRTTVPHSAPVLPSAVEVYAGAAWHERETHEMFGVTFEGHPGLDPLLLPEGFEGHPLRKDFVLAARVAKAWPGAKEPGESEHGGPKRRQMLPPGVPDPNEWGPLKGQLSPAPARPARGAGRAAGARGATAAATDRPARRTRTAADGSASQTTTAAPGVPAAPQAGTPASPEAGTPAAPEAVSAGAGAAPAGPTRDAPSAPRPPDPAPRAAQPKAPAEPTTSAEPESAAEPKAPAEPTTPAEPRSAAEPKAPTASRGSDAPWHHARPAFDEPEPPKNAPSDGPQPKPQPVPESVPEPQPEKADADAADTDSATDAPAADDPDSPTGGAQ
ncbi:NADH-quinone oxidoreductase subunit C [Streptomyces sp. NBC_00414]|uniref:NADH-quinone oxidoreductase subunit C n=1 Tax=Streptomyces sp. NBC_00414 TaxID=2975739 RepID=UPI002E1E3378